MDNAHCNADALRALVGALGAQKQEVALEADLTASALSNLLSGYRDGRSEDLRRQLADALDRIAGDRCHVTVRAITCHCDNPAVHETRQADR